MTNPSPAGLSDIQQQALSLIGGINEHNLGARMPYAELIAAANELEGLGLTEWLEKPTGRWLTDAGRAALTKASSP